MASTKSSSQNANLSLPRRSRAQSKNDDVKSTIVKSEPEPPCLPSSPLATRSPELLAAGTHRVHPIPPNCRQGAPGYTENRKVWMQSAAREVRSWGVTVTKVKLLSDGLVIDWERPSKETTGSDLPPLQSQHALTTTPAPVPVKSRTPSIPSTVSPTSTQAPVPITPASSSQPQSAPTTATVTNGPRPQSIFAKLLAKQKLVLAQRQNEVRLQMQEEAERQQEIEKERMRSPMPVTPPPYDDYEDHHSAFPEPPTTSSSQVSSRSPTVELRKYFPLPRSKKSTLQVASTSNQADTPLLHSSERSLRRQASSVLPTHVAKRPRVETPSKVECEKLEENALQWLSRYITTFDSDRAALASAYSQYATFSIRTLSHLAKTRRRSPVLTSPSTVNTTGVKSGTFDILSSLLELPDSFSFNAKDSEHPPTVEYDLVVAFDMIVYGISGSGGPGVMVVCYVDPQGTHEPKDKDGGRWVCEMQFILRQRAWDDNDAGVDGLWDLVALSHQMTLRRIPAHTEWNWT